MSNEDNTNAEVNMNTTSTSQYNIDTETYNDGNSDASSANSLQISLLENKLDAEITKKGKIMQDTISSLTEHTNLKFTELDTKFKSLVADITPNNQNSNVNSSIAQTTQIASEDRISTPNVACSAHSKKDNYQFKMKPQNFSGATDFDEFLSQFEITCEINGWQYREKSLYLANCLTGDACSLLSELDPEGRRDYDTLVEKLANRFGSVHRSEIYRTQLKSRSRNRGESIPELAQAVKKLVRQAYPGVNKDVIETLSTDNFIDALNDSEIRLRVRELGPKTLAEAERTALRLESHKIADKQRSRLVGQIETNTNQKSSENQGDANKLFKSLQSSLDSLLDHVKDLKRQNNVNRSHSQYANGRQNNSNFDPTGRHNRPYKSNPPLSNGPKHDSDGQNRSNNYQRNRHYGTYQNQSAQGLHAGANPFVPRSRQNHMDRPVNNNSKNGSTHFENNQGNWNQSVWGATTRQH